MNKDINRSRLAVYLLSIVCAIYIFYVMANGVSGFPVNFIRLQNYVIHLAFAGVVMLLIVDVASIVTYLLPERVRLKCYERMNSYWYATGNYKPLTKIGFLTALFMEVPISLFAIWFFYCWIFA